VSKGEGGACLAGVLGHEDVVGADGGDEEHGADAVKGLDPLAPLGPLPADVDHAVRVVLELEVGLDDADGARLCVQDVLVGRRVVRPEQPVDVPVVHEAVDRQQRNKEITGRGTY
jgi:hypothetical protein